MDLDKESLKAWLDCYLSEEPQGLSLSEFVESVYKRGVADGMWKYAWWKDGTQWIGNCGTKLKDAVEKFNREWS